MRSTKQSKNNQLGEAVDKIQSAALNYLARREYSVWELRSKLLSRGADEEKTEQVLTKLITLGYLDDIRYSLAYVRHRREFRPCGAAMIRQKLRAEQIDEQIIADALDQEYDESRQRQTVADLIRKENSKYAENVDELDMQKAREKTVRRLMTKGFPLTMILKEMEEIEDKRAEGHKLSIDSSREK